MTTDELDASNDGRFGSAHAQRSTGLRAAPKRIASLQLLLLCLGVDLATHLIIACQRDGARLGAHFAGARPLKTLVEAHVLAVLAQPLERAARLGHVQLGV